MTRQESRGVAEGLGRLAALDGGGDTEALVRDVLRLLTDSLRVGLAFLSRVDGEALYVEHVRDVADMGLTPNTAIPLCDTY